MNSNILTQPITTCRLYYKYCKYWHTDEHWCDIVKIKNPMYVHTCPLEEGFVEDDNDDNFAGEDQTSQD